jgi:aerobic carbon-monoxide dehydrogenase medium subunit
MIPPEFEYAVPETIEEAIGILGADEDAKLLAGGHSLLPLMKLRLAAPTTLVDLRKVPGLTGVERVNGHWRIGAMTRHKDLQDRSDLGLLAQAARQIADQQVRNRGTIGGSVAHVDPASDLPTIALALDATMVATGPGGATREIPAGEFFQDYLTTALAPDEVLTELRVPHTDGEGSAYLKFTRRAEDWAMVGVAASVKVVDGVVDHAHVGLTHMGSTPIRATAVEEALRGKPADAASIAAAAEHAAEGTSPPGDLNASPDYKRHLARVLTRRALEQAVGA